MRRLLILLLLTVHVGFINAGVFKVKNYSDGKYEGYFDEFEENGEYYEGFYGKGKYTYNNGDYEDGEWARGEFIEGTVKSTYDNGDVYTGKLERIDDKFFRHGKGIYTFKNGDYEDGLWERDNLIQGKVKLTYTNGNVYVGEMLEDKKHGEGIYTYKDGDYYSGFWQSNNFKYGKIKESYDSGNSYIGEAIANEYDEKIYKEGEGIYTYKNGNQIRAIWTNGEVTEKLPILKEEDIKLLTDKIEELDYNIVWEFNGNSFFDNYYDLVYDSGINSLVGTPSKENNKNDGYDEVLGIGDDFFIYNNTKLNIEKESSGVLVNNWKEPLYFQEKSKVIYPLRQGSKTGASYTENNYWRSYRLYIPVKKIPNEDGNILEDFQLTVLEKIRKYAINLTAREILPSTEDLKIPEFAIPIIERGEFETTIAFEKRKQNLVSDLEKERALKLEEVLKKEKENKEQLKNLENLQYLKSIYEKNLKKSTFIVLGKPYVKSAEYDADKQVMKLKLVSAIEHNFLCDTEVFVPIASAKDYKEKILSYTLIPSITFGKNMETKTTKFNLNNSVVKMGFEIARNNDTIEGYEKFIEKYPNTAESKVAQNEIKKKENKVKSDKLKEEKEEKEWKIAQEKAYSIKKKIGDNVQVEAKGMWSMFGQIHIIRGQVQKVIGNRILIRITNTGGATSLNDDKIYVGAEIWADYNNWMKK